MKKQFFLLASTVGLTFSLQSQVLLPTDAAAWDKGGGSTSGTGSGGLIDQTISTTSDFLNFNGQPNDPSAWTSDAESWTGDFQGEDVDSLSGNPWIVYDLGSSYTTLDFVYIITNAEANRGFKDIRLYYSDNISSNNITNWASGGGLTNGAASVVDYDFTAGGWTLFGTDTLVDVNDGFGTQPQISYGIDISSIASARYIGIEGLSTFNDDGGANPFGTATGSNARAGINQIAFTVVPEPSSALLLMLGSAGLFLLRRR